MSKRLKRLDLRKVSLISTINNTVHCIPTVKIIFARSRWIMCLMWLVHEFVLECSWGNPPSNLTQSCKMGRKKLNSRCRLSMRVPSATPQRDSNIVISAVFIPTSWATRGKFSWETMWWNLSWRDFRTWKIKSFTASNIDLILLVRLMIY